MDLIANKEKERPLPPCFLPNNKMKLLQVKKRLINVNIVDTTLFFFN